jgi:hypothetical protein
MMPVRSVITSQSKIKKSAKTKQKRSAKTKHTKLCTKKLRNNDNKQLTLQQRQNPSFILVFEHDE